MRLVNSSKAVLAKKLTALLEGRKGISRLDLSRQMGGGRSGIGLQQAQQLLVYFIETVFHAPHCAC